jgi:hypothetical protein
MQYIQARIYYDPYLRKTDLSGLNFEFNLASNELKGYLSGFWNTHSKWQENYINYIKNMKKRSLIANISDHIKITTNPVIILGMRGGSANGKLILGNNGTQAVPLDAYLGLPSNHWSLTKPEAIIINNLYHLKHLKIPSRQTREIQITISFPNSLSFAEYKSILKFYQKPFKLLPEIN